MKRIVAPVIAMLCTSCFAADLPNPKFTPGVARQATVQEICSTSTSSVRLTTNKMKSNVYAKYGVKAQNDKSCTGPYHACYEVDHLIPLEVGGADVEANLWPQAYDGIWNAKHKDKLENYARKQLCSGKMTRDQVNKMFTDNWITSYMHVFGSAGLR